MAVIHRVSTENTLTLTDVLATDFTTDEIHPDWIRWCYTSINKYFDDRKGPYDLYLEGNLREEMKEEELAELRIDGPEIFRPSKGTYYLIVQINVLCQTHLDPRQHYTAQRMVGTFAKIFTNSIPIFKYGSGPLDDGSLLGCLHLVVGGGEAVDVNYFGVITSDTKILQTSIEGHYRLEL